MLQNNYKIRLWLLALIGLSLFIIFVLPSYTSGKKVTIRINKNGFIPNIITISKGDTISFENSDTQEHWPASNIHPSHAIYPEFDSKKGILTNKSWKFTFDKEGVWKYHDHLDPKIIGTIYVISEDTSMAKPSGQTIASRLMTSIKHFFNNITKRVKNSEHISKDSKDIFNDKEALETYIGEYGPKETIKQLNFLSSEFGSCHDPAHVAGRLTYELMGEEAFRECGSECHSGCYHGATEAYFKEHGTNNLSKNLNTLCGDELNGFFSHQCIHGIGHGLMAWASYDIFEALKSCDLLDSRRDSCWTGVFMENIVGGG
jgi:plastocyanin